MEKEEFEVTYKTIAQKRKKKNVGQDGRNYMTTYYSVLLKQKIDALTKIVEWRQENIKVLASKRNKRKQSEQAITF